MTKVRQRTILKSIGRHWTPFVEQPLNDEIRSKFPFLRHCAKIYSNSRFECQLYPCKTTIGGVWQVNLKRHGDIADITWADIQRVKNEIFTPEHTAVEVFPAESQAWRVNANVRVFWVLPELWLIPFGMHHPSAWGNPE